MAWANLVRSTNSRAVSSGSKICSKQSGNAAKIRAGMMMVRTFSGLRVNNSLCNMVNKRSCHDFHSTTIASSSATSVEKAASPPPILPKGELDMFTDKAKEVIKLAQRETKRAGYKFVGPEMILLGLIGNDIDRIFVERTDIATKVLYSMGIYLEDAREKVQEIFGCCGPSLSLSGEIPFRHSALTAFQRSLAEAQQLGHSYIGSEHLLLGLLRRGGEANRVLKKLGARPKHIRTQVMSMIEENAAQVVGDGSSGNEMPTLEEYGLDLSELADEKKLDLVVQGPTQRIADFVVNGSSGNKMPTLESLEKLGHNLTEQAYKKELKPFVDRKPLVNTVIQILGRPSKNIPCLVGEDGVGKTSIVEGLAQRIADFDVPDFLSKKKVINLNEYIFREGNLMKLLEEIKECNEFIFFIDDVDQLENSGIDRACNILMPAVARGEVQCVVATTPDEYLHMMKYPALQRLFQPIKVPEATVDETFKILKGREERYGNRDKVCYTDEALVAAAHMSDQNIWHSFLPSKAIDLIDLAGESVSRKEKSQASVLRDQEMGHKINMLEIEQRMDDMKKKNSKSLGCTVTKADIEDVISDISHLHAILYRLFGDAGSYEELGGWSKLYKTFYDEEEFE